MGDPPALPTVTTFLFSRLSAFHSSFRFLTFSVPPSPLRVSAPLREPFSYLRLKAWPFGLRPIRYRCPFDSRRSLCGQPLFAYLVTLGCGLNSHE